MSFVALGGVISFGVLDGVAAGLLGGVVGGAGLGAAESAITGGNVGKGALMGAAGGALTAGVGGALGSMGGAAVEAGTEAAANTGAQAAGEVAMSDMPSSFSNAATTAGPGIDALGPVNAAPNLSTMGGETIAGAAPNAGTTGVLDTTPATTQDITGGLVNKQPVLPNSPIPASGANTPVVPPAATTSQGPKFFDDPVGWVKNNQGTAAMGALGLGTAAYGMMHPTNYGIPSSSTVNQGPITPYKYDPSKYQPNYPVPNVYVPHYAEGGIAQLADGGMAGTPPNMLDGPADLDFMGGGAFPMSQQTRSFYASPTQMPTSAQQAMASYEPNTNPLTGEPVAHMAQGGIAQLAVGGKLLHGPGDGVSDSIHANIGGRQEARLADGEFVIPARIVSELGNGSTDAGAKHLYAMMNRVQNHRRRTVGKDKVAVDSKARKALPA